MSYLKAAIISISCFICLLIFIPKISAVSPETFNSSGTFNDPDGIYLIDVACWGGGGGGGGSAKSKTSSSGGGGGGGGAYAKTTGIGVTPASGYAVVIGAGGSGGTAGNTGLPGTSSTFFTNLIIAVGGSGGGPGGASVGTSGIGGAAGSCTGDADKKFSGGNGATGSSTYGSGGGGGAGDTAGGTNASGQTGGAGGTNNGGRGGDGGASGADGIGGSAPGGGGGGGGKGGVSSGFNGGPGNSGRCIINYSDTWAPSVNQSIYTPTWSFATNPTNVSPSEIGMTATTGFDYTGPIKYLFTLDNTNCSVGHSGSGGTSSVWQTDKFYNDTGLEPNKCYGYTVNASDSVGTTHVGTVSSSFTTYTSANTPGVPSLYSPTLATLNLTNDINGNPISNPATYYAVQVVTTSPNDSNWLNKWVASAGNPNSTPVWMQQTMITSLLITSLKSGTTYGVRIKAKNQDNDETPLSSEAQATTLTPIISVSITSGSVSYGVVGAGSTISTIDLSQTQTLKNEGNVTEDFVIKTSNANGGIGWTLASAPGTDTFVHEFSTDGGTGWTKFVAPDSYQAFLSTISMGRSQNFDLRLIAPTNSSDATLKTIDVTVLATRH